MARFLVEAYVARANGTNVTEAVRRIERAAERLTSNGVPVHYLRSILVPGDETCFHLFESPSLEAVHEVGRRAQLEFDRVTEAVEPVSREGELR